MSIIAILSQSCRLRRLQLWAKFCKAYNGWFVKLFNYLFISIVSLTKDLFPLQGVLLFAFGGFIDILLYLLLWFYFCHVCPMRLRIYKRNGKRKLGLYTVCFTFLIRVREVFTMVSVQNKETVALRVVYVSVDASASTNSRLRVRCHFLYIHYKLYFL